MTHELLAKNAEGSHQGLFCSYKGIKVNWQAFETHRHSHLKHLAGHQDQYPLDADVVPEAALSVTEQPWLQETYFENNLCQLRFLMES